jgi:hypothetical protein
MTKPKKNANRKLTRPHATKQTATCVGSSNERSIIDNTILMKLIPAVSIIIIVVAIYLSPGNSDGISREQTRVVHTEPSRKQSDALDKALPEERKLTFIDPAEFGRAWDLISYFSKDYDLKVDFILHFHLLKCTNFAASLHCSCSILIS